jgi:hypothetical protein
MFDIYNNIFVILDCFPSIGKAHKLIKPPWDPYLCIYPIPTFEPPDRFQRNMLKLYAVGYLYSEQHDRRANILARRDTSVIFFRFLT